MILQIFCAARVIDMPVADNRVFDIFRIEAELHQAAGNFILDGVVPDRVHDDDSLGCGDRPCGIFGLADEIEIVENLHGLGVPLGTGGGPGRLSLRRARRGRRLGRRAERD